METLDRWEDARRIEAWAGEVRVNLIRLAALVAFYGHHLVNVYLVGDDPSLAGRFHTGVTALVLAWSALVLVLYFGLARRWMPGWLMYAVVAWDILMVTALLMLTVDPASKDARSWLAVLYFVVIASAPLRLSLPLVYVATLGSMAAYVFFLGFAKYWLEAERPSRPNQIIFLLALGAVGLLAGQMVRQARRLVQGYPVEVAEPQEATA